MGKQATLLVPIEAFHWGARTFLPTDDPIASTDPGVKGKEHLFRAFEVESATASPGEKRSVTIPKKTTRKKPAATRKST